MTMLLTDSGNLNNIIDELKRSRDDEDLTLPQELELYVNELNTYLRKGYPFQDVLTDQYGPTGVPISLARIVLAICQYCADHNIDLVDAMREII
jgi:hypothetical protein